MELKFGDNLYDSTALEFNGGIEMLTVGLWFT